jgi:hypothetical protein
MVRNASLFSQLLQHISRTEFAALVKEHQAERGSKGFTCWTQCVAMLFCHLARADSLREICNGLACCLGKLNHLGIERAPKKSTLAYANQHRPAELYESLFWSLLTRFRSSKLLGSEHQRPFKFKNRLQSLDSTTISLCLELFPWAEYRQTKGGVKVHILLDHSDYMPSYAVITEGKHADVRIAQSLELKPGSIVAMDRAYNDFELFGRWSRNAVFFVTRMKKGTVYEVVEQRDLPQNRPILADEIIRFTSRKAKKDCPELLRRVVVWDAEKEREIVLLTNHLEFGATTISTIYRDRWKIELFFKALKQNLKVKTFIGTSENALRIQIWTALIAMLLLRWLHHLSKARWSFSTLTSMLRLNLFTYRSLKEWLDDPYRTPPDTSPPEQFTFDFAGLGQPNP